MISASLGVVLLGILLFRNSNSEDTLRGSVHTLPGLALPEGPLEEAPRLFFWTHIPGGNSYRFELIDDELQSLETATSTKPWIILPVEVYRRLRPKRTYIWTVEVISDDNLKIGEIRRFFELR